MVVELRAAIINPHAMMLALCTIGAVSMVVYGHHLYTTGLEGDVLSYFSWATYLVAIPTGAKFFTWIASLSGAQGGHDIPSQGAIGFLWYFLVGGLTGVVLADSALDQSLHDAYYVVAHFHLVMAVAIIYSLSAEVSYLRPTLHG